MSFLDRLFNKGDKFPDQPGWQDLGTIADEFEIAHLHPLHHNYPSWKGGTRWLKLLRTNWGNEIVFTQGLASTQEKNGHEIYLETSEPIASFSDSWQANLVYEVGKIIPNVADLDARLTKFKYLSLQINIEGAPRDWSLEHPNGNIGLLLGLPNSRLASFRPAYFTPVNIKLLRPAEMLYIINNGAEGRNKVAELIAAQGDVAVSSLDRPSVV